MYHFRNRYLNFVNVGDTFKFLNTGEIFEIVQRQDRSDFYCETTSGKGFRYSLVNKGSIECIGDTCQNIVQRIIQNKIDYLVEFFNFENEIELSTNVQDPNKHFKTFEKRFGDIQISTYAPDLVDIRFIGDFRDYLETTINKENFQTYGIKDSYLTMIPNEYFYYISKLCY